MKETYIITPTWNNTDYTIRCFGSVAKNTQNYKIIWIDNGSDPNSKKEVETFLQQENIPYELIANDENLGFVKATNQGVKVALSQNTQKIVLLNNDVEVYVGWLDKMSSVLKNNQRVGIVGPLVSPTKGSWQSITNLKKEVEEFSDLPLHNSDNENYANIISQKYHKKIFKNYRYIAFFCALIRPEVFRQIGLLSEEYGIGFSDDNDFGFRAMNAGWENAVAKDVFIFHNHRTTFKSIYTVDEIEAMQRANKKILDKKFGKGDYRPGLVSDIIDVDELKVMIKEKESEIQQQKEAIKQINQRTIKIQNSKSFRLGDLFSRSIRSPFKIITLPINVIMIMLEDKINKDSFLMAMLLKIKKWLTIIKKDPSRIVLVLRKKLVLFYQNFILNITLNNFVFRKNISPTVSVIMTTFNSREDVVRAIKSILDQSYKKIELIIVDDESTDNTLDIINREAERDPRIKILQNHSNRGTYWCKNYAIRFAKGEYITFHDSDDTAKPDRILWQLKALLLFKNAIASVVNYIRIRKDGSVIGPLVGKKERLLSSGTMYHKSVFKKVGFFDSIRFGADSEFLRRVETYFSDVSNSVIHINKVLYIALTRDEALTSKESKIDFEKGVISDERSFHIKTSNHFHQKNLNQKDELFFSFPLRKRPFELPKKMTRDLENNFNVVACVDFFDKKEEELRESIGEILSEIDLLYLRCEKDKNVPEFLNGKKVMRIYNESQEDMWTVPFADMRTNQKETFFFSLSTLIRYPNDYIEKMIIKNQSYGNTSVFGLVENISSKELVTARSSDSLMEKIDLRSISFHSSVSDRLLSDFESLDSYLIERNENWIDLVV